MNNTLSIYVHIPFCNSKCFYCDFFSLPQTDECKKKYINSLINEILSYKTNKQVSSIYFGGGTPSVVSENLICNVLEKIKENFIVKQDAEITIEANPCSLTLEKLKKYYNAGFNRISLGVQTTNKKSLEFIGRVYGKNLKNYKKIVKNALKNIKKVGFKNISCDLMLGLPQNNKKHLNSDLKFLTKFTSHISTYMLMIEEGTKLFEKLKESEKTEQQALAEYDFVLEFLRKKNFERYEVSNFAKGGAYSRHNQNYWQGGDYLGFGAGAHSHISPIRFSNVENVEKYIDYYSTVKPLNLNNLESELKNINIKDFEKLSKKEYAEEAIMLSLRTSSGLDVESFTTKFYDILEDKKEEINFLLENNLIYGLPNKIILTDKGFLVANQVILKLIK